jgi:hypothetical protein
LRDLADVCTHETRRTERTYEFVYDFGCHSVNSRVDGNHYTPRVCILVVSPTSDRASEVTAFVRGEQVRSSWCQKFLSMSLGQRYSLARSVD